MFFSFIAAVMKSMMKKIKCRSLFLLWDAAHSFLARSGESPGGSPRECP